MDLLLHFVTLNGQMPFYLNFSGNLIIIHIFATCFSEAFSWPKIVAWDGRVQAWITFELGRVCEKGDR